MKLIAINRFIFDGYAAREMLFNKGIAGSYTLVGSSESPDDVIDETALNEDAALEWLAQAGDGVELIDHS